MEAKEVLLTNIRSFLNSANIVYKTEDFTSATILYFKTLFAVFDLIILKDLGKIPKDHTERFRVLEMNYPLLYILLDKLYPKYRDSYNMIISKEDCDKIKENVERIIKEQRIL